MQTLTPIYFMFFGRGVTLRCKRQCIVTIVPTIYFFTELSFNFVRIQFFWRLAKCATTILFIDEDLHHYTSLLSAPVRSVSDGSIVSRGVPSTNYDGR